MRNFLVAVALVVFSGTAFASPAVVEMKSLGYDPKVLTIKVGDTVQWKNVAFTEHYATSDDGKAFDVGPVAPKTASQPIAFPTAGEFKYHCKIHGKTGALRADYVQFHQILL